MVVPSVLLSFAQVCYEFSALVRRERCVELQQFVEVGVAIVGHLASPLVDVLVEGLGVRSIAGKFLEEGLVVVLPVLAAVLHPFPPLGAQLFGNSPLIGVQVERFEHLAPRGAAGRWPGNGDTSDAERGE